MATATIEKLNAATYDGYVQTRSKRCKRAADKIFPKLDLRLERTEFNDEDGTVLFEFRGATAQQWDEIITAMNAVANDFPGGGWVATLDPPR